MSASPIKIGEGGNGCAYRPSFKCKAPPVYGADNIKWLTGKDTISKISKKSIIDLEIDIYKRLGFADIDPENKFHIGHPVSCAVGDINASLEGKSKCSLANEDSYQIIYPYGGMDIDEYVRRRGDIIDLLRAVYNVVIGLALMNRKHAYHLDVKSSNMVAGGSPSTIRLIDFGLSEKINPKNADIKSINVISGQFRNLYYAYPLDAAFFLAFKPVSAERIDEWYANTQKDIKIAIDYYVYRGWNKTEIFRDLQSESEKRGKMALFSESMRKVDVYSLALMILDLSHLTTVKAVQYETLKLLDSSNALHYNPFKRCTMAHFKRAYLVYINNLLYIKEKGTVGERKPYVKSHSGSKTGKSSGTSRTSKTGKTSGTSKTGKTSKTTRTSKTGKTTRTSKTGKTSGTSETGKTSGTSETGKTSKTGKTRKTARN
jgi:serine/threonine protein kinase